MTGETIAFGRHRYRCKVLLILILICVHWIYLPGWGSIAGFCEHNSELILHKIVETIRATVGSLRKTFPCFD
jgi:hypothetical protein